jgi:hypothetical protein
LQIIYKFRHVVTLDKFERNLCLRFSIDIFTDDANQIIINRRKHFPLFKISEQKSEIIANSTNDGKEKIIPFLEEFMAERQEIQEKNEEKRELGEMNPILSYFSGLLIPFHEMAKLPKNHTVPSFEPKFEKNGLNRNKDEWNHRQEDQENTIKEGKLLGNESHLQLKSGDRIEEMKKQCLNT